MRKPTSTQSENRRVLGRHCVAHEALARLSLRWKVGVLYSVGEGASTYGALKRALPNVTDQVLAKRLRELVDERLVVKVAAAEGKGAPRYAVTSSGREALEIAAAVCRWAKRNDAVIA